MRTRVVWLVAMLLLAPAMAAVTTGATTPLTLEGRVLTSDGSSIVRGATVSLLVHNDTGALVHQDLAFTGEAGNFTFTVPAALWDPGWNATVRASYSLVGAEGSEEVTLSSATTQQVDVRIPWDRVLGALVSVARPHVTTPRDGIANFVVNATNGGNDTDPVVVWAVPSNASIQAVFNPSNSSELSPGETSLLSLTLSNPGLEPRDYSVELGWRSEWYPGEGGTVDLTWTVLPDVDLKLPSSLVTWWPDPLLDGEGAVLNCTVVNSGRDPAVKANVTVEVVHPTSGLVLRDRVRMDVPGKGSAVASFPWTAVYSEEPYALSFEVDHPLDGSHGDDRAQVPLAVGVSNEPPVVSFLAPANGTAVKGTVTVRLSVTDPDTPVTAVHLRVGDGEWVDLPPADPRFQWDTASVADGWYVLEAYASDRYSDGAVTVHHLKVENLGPNHPPEIYVEAPLEGDTVADTLKARGIAFDEDDNVEEVRLRVDSDAWQVAQGTNRWSANLSTAGLSEGSHVLQVLADDGIDFSEIVSVQFHVTKAAATRLTVSLDAAPGTVLPGENVDIEGELVYDNGARPEGLSVRIEGPSGLLVFKTCDARGAFRLTTSAPSSAGTYTYTASATDDGGLAASNSTTLRVLRSLDPDLTVESIDIGASRAAVGSDVTVAVEVRNLGYTTGNGTLRAWAGAPGSGDLLDERSVTVYTGITVSFVWVPEDKGEVELNVEVVDVQPSDANASNNRRSLLVEVVDLPDLTVGSLALSNPRPYDNTTVTVSVRVENLGGMNASCTVKLYLDGTEAENLLGDVDANVDAQGMAFVTMDMRVTVGPHVLYAEIVNSYPEESDEENNGGTLKFTVGGPYEPPVDTPENPFLGPFDPFTFMVLIVVLIGGAIGGVLFLRHS